ncbi:MAG: type IV toxin-antitoxin system AbiEi family antitoxin, partial [Candidatus Sulfotelmatobacter sp.]
MRESELEREAEQVFQSIFEELSKVRVRSKAAHSATNNGWDLAFDVVSGQKKFRFCIEVKSRVTPQTALSISEQFRAMPKGAIPVLFAPTISPRVAEIVRGRGIGYADRAGNCWLSSPQDHLFIERKGFQTERQPTPAAADPFSNKSSRIIRAVLSRPMEGWQVRKLAEHPDVQVSPGLVVKVKRALVEEGYAIEHNRLLYLRDPAGLLTAWSQKYPGPAEQIPLYIRGDATAAEQTISQWCRDNGLQYALAAFSAAWRLAPEVRYNVAAAYLEDRGFDQKLLDQLATKYGGKRVDTGPNIYLWRPFDQSVFAGSVVAGQPERPVTSSLQTYLDLKRAAGRGEDAANAIFEKYLS